MDGMEWHGVIDLASDESAFWDDSAGARIHPVPSWFVASFDSHVLSWCDS